jgi:hypothetical protein
VSLRARRLWVGGFLAILAVFGFGQLEAWPFTNWYMFSFVEPKIDRVARVVAVSPDGSERTLDGATLPLGLLNHPLMQRIDRADAADRGRICASLLAAAREGAETIAVRVEERSWVVLDRRGDRPANVTTTVHLECR